MHGAARAHITARQLSSLILPKKRSTIERVDLRMYRRVNPIRHPRDPQRCNERYSFNVAASQSRKEVCGILNDELLPSIRSAVERLGLEHFKISYEKDRQS